ncbi:MAG: hypothetical protein A2004_11445 [Spirochaetes bacterium GWC1_61_12]|nr:MAG: hypothetical protein A2Y37_12565 [Spirochaetes bacterium GWB1_60_80]OHD30429.1 MAG: hypothetical protein A2004_11445 [Spirochaetes bacterium GWC1_61_12]OHD43233.1 MAG: hypothetical protein A2Y35_08385 [Spirochaetes bacterium GWE1_60_18]OHD58793.1 MAG: hypothetical protein A2Y32_01220 [Spirochaetes bacterium GWF1_60_12]HAP43316.1 hypothetical protein [Spirochaetaceae bacterium]
MKFGWKQAGRKFPWYGIVGMVVGGLALAVLFAFLFGWVVMLLWNRIMPDIFGLKTISYWQAWGLVILAHILVKPGYGGKSGGKAGGRPRMGARGRWEWCDEAGGTTGSTPRGQTASDESGGADPAEPV